MRHIVVIALVAAAFTSTAAVAKPPPLRIGQQCALHKRYAGFVCRQLASSDPPTLFKVARPALAPQACPGITPTPTSVPPNSTSVSVGSSPFWVHPGVSLDVGTGIWRYTDNALGAGGWAIKWGWQAAPGIAPISASITNLANGRRLVIAIHGTQKRTAQTLDARNALVEPPNSWSSYVVFPRAGCYRVDASWPGGSWNLVFAFGR